MDTSLCPSGRPEEPHLRKRKKRNSNARDRRLDEESGTNRRSWGACEFERWLEVKRLRGAATAFKRALQFSRRAKDVSRGKGRLYALKLAALVRVAELAPETIKVTIDDDGQVGLPSILFIPTKQRVHLTWPQLSVVERTKPMGSKLGESIMRRGKERTSSTLMSQADTHQRLRKCS